MVKGYGKYYEIVLEKDFFEESKRSKKFVCYFYRDSIFRCKIIDKYLEILVFKNVEIKFVKINVEKCSFLVERFRIVVLFILCIVIDGKIIDYIVGFDELGGVDDFFIEMMEWRLGRVGVINYQGDLVNLLEFGEKKKGGILGFSKIFKIIKGRDDDDSSDEDDW